MGHRPFALTLGHHNSTGQTFPSDSKASHLDPFKAQAQNGFPLHLSSVALKDIGMYMDNLIGRDAEVILAMFAKELWQVLNKLCPALSKDEVRSS